MRQKGINKIGGGFGKRHRFGITSDKTKQNDSDTKYKIEKTETEAEFSLCPLRFKPEDNNLTIEGKIFSDQTTPLGEFIKEHYGISGRYNINTIPFNEKEKKIKLEISDVCKDDIALVDYLRYITIEKNIVDLEKEFSLPIKQKIYSKTKSFVNEFTPKHFKKNLVKHGPYIAAAIGIGAVIDHVVIPGIAIIYKQPWWATLALFHFPEILSVGLYFKIRGWVSKSKIKKYGKKLDPLLNQYLNSLFKRTHNETENIEKNIKKLLVLEGDVNSNLTSLFDYEKKFLTTHSRADIERINMISIGLQKKLGKKEYKDLKGYASAVELEHLTENPNFKSEDVLKYIVARDQLLDSIKYEHKGDVIELFQKRLKSHN